MDGLVSRASMIRLSLHPLPASETSAFNKIRAFSTRRAGLFPFRISVSSRSRSSPLSLTTYFFTEISFAAMIDARGDEHDARALERVVIAVDDVDLRPERRAVAHVGCYRLRGLAGAVDEHDLARAAADDGGHRAGAADTTRSNNANLHGLLRCRAVNPPMIRSFRTRAWKELDLSDQPSK